MKNPLVPYQPSEVNLPPLVSMFQKSSMTLDGAFCGEVGAWPRHGLIAVMSNKVRIRGIVEVASNRITAVSPHHSVEALADLVRRYTALCCFPLQERNTWAAFH